MHYIHIREIVFHPKPLIWSTPDPFTFSAPLPPTPPYEPFFEQWEQSAKDSFLERPLSMLVTAHASLPASLTPLANFEQKYCITGSLPVWFLWPPSPPPKNTNSKCLPLSPFIIDKLQPAYLKFAQYNYKHHQDHLIVDCKRCFLMENTMNCLHNTIQLMEHSVPCI